MHVKSLKVFCDIVGRRSFSRAADENGLSQSGASQIVHHLEERLDVKLIDRTKRPFVLTPEGEIYYDGCRDLVQRYYALEEKVRTVHRDISGRVSIASIYSVGLAHMNQYVQHFLTQHRKADVRVEYQHPDRVYALVEEDQVELGLVSYPRSSRNIEVIPWREEPLVLVCAAGHPLAGRDSVTLSELDGERLVGFVPELKIRREIDRALAAAHVDVRVVMEFDNIETIKRAVEIDSGVCLLPEPTVRRETASGALVAIPLSDVVLARPLGIIYRRGKELSETVKSFIDLLLRKTASREHALESTGGTDDHATAAVRAP
ncbi:MAG: LysR family transcriptional regulator [Pirellulales bacterium]